MAPIATEEKKETQPQQVETKAVVPSGTAAQQTAQEQLYKFGGKEYRSVDDLGKAYEAAQTELGKWTQQHGDLKKQYDETQQKAARWEDWWKAVGPLWGDDVEDFLRKKIAGGQRQQQQGQQALPHGTQQQQAQQVQQQAAQVAQQVADAYDFYRPEEVARFKQAIANELAQAYRSDLGQVLQGINQTLQQKEQWYQTYLSNHLSLLRRAFEEKMKNPNFNIEQVMEGAAKAIGGQIDPIELGQKLLSAASLDGQIEEAKKAAYAQGKKDAVQEAENKKQEAVPSVNVQVPKYTVPTTPNGTRRGLHTLRESAAQNILQKFGPGWLTGG